MLNQLNFVSDLEKTEKEKKVRIILLIFLGITIIPSLIFWAISQWQEHPPAIGQVFENIDFSRSDTASGAPYNLYPKLNSWAESNIETLPGKWSIKIEFLESEFSWQRYSLTKFQSEGLISLPILTAYYHQLETEDFILDDEIEVELSFSEPGVNQVLINELGRPKINYLLLDWGMRNTDLSDKTTNAEDVSHFFTKLYQDEIISKEHQQIIYGQLDQVKTELITAGLPQGINFYGLDGVSNNFVYGAGIVSFPDNPYVLVVVAEEADVNFSRQKLTEIVDQIYWLIAENI